MPEACPCMRSTAKGVLPVFVGPRTAMSREASPRAGERFMSVNVADAGAARKPKRALKCEGLLTPPSLFLDRKQAAPLLPLRAEGATLSRTLATAIGGKQNVSWTGRGHGPRCAGQALRAALRRLHAGDAPLDRRDLGGGPSLVCGRPLSHLVGHSQQPDAALCRGIGPGVGLPA